MDNSVHLVGVISREPVFYDGEIPKLEMVLKLHRDWVSKRDGEPRSKDSYFDIVCFNENAVAGKDLHYGDSIIVLGKLNIRTFTSEGVKSDRAEISADHLGRSL